MKTKMTLNPIDVNKDMLLQMAISQGYVSKNCLLAGGLVMALVNEGKNPCDGCSGKSQCFKTAGADFFNKL
jgi:hypothetical protein